MASQYQLIMQTLKERIASGRITGRLPSIAALEAEFGVSHATVKKVIDQLKLLGIVYGQQGKGVFISDKRPEKKGTVAVFLPIEMYGTPFYMRLFSALQPDLETQGYEVVSCTNIADMFAANADWAVVFGDPQQPGSDQQLQHSFENRIILINQPVGAAYAVNNNNFRTGYQAMEYLYSCGHRKIGMLTRETQIVNGVFFARLEGALEFAAKHPDVTLVSQSIRGDEITGNIEILATQAAVELLDKAPDLTAIFSFTDVLAIGVLSELQRRKLRIPEDISLVSVDNRSFAGLCNPPLTTFEEDAEEMAREVVRLIEANFQTGLAHDGRTLIAAKFIERKSVKQLIQQQLK